MLAVFFQQSLFDRQPINSWFVTASLDDHEIVKIFPKLAMFFQINQYGSFVAIVIYKKLEAILFHYFISLI